MLILGKDVRAGQKDNGEGLDLDPRGDPEKDPAHLLWVGAGLAFGRLVRPPSPRKAEEIAVRQEARAERQAAREWKKQVGAAKAGRSGRRKADAAVRGGHGARGGGGGPRR